MKYLLVLAIIVAVAWLWRANRPAVRKDRDAPPRPQAQAQLQDMVSCAVCDLHFPLADATTGSKGALYCSAEHRQRAEG